MKKTLFYLLIILNFSFQIYADGDKENKINPEEITLPIFLNIEQAPTIAFYKSLHHGYDSSLIALFPDGKAIWSKGYKKLCFAEDAQRPGSVGFEDAYQNGGPYYMATMNKDDITSLVLKYNNMKVFTDPGEYNMPVQRGSSYKYFVINTPEHRISLRAFGEVPYNMEKIDEDFSILSHFFSPSQIKEYKKFAANINTIYYDLINLIGKYEKDVVEVTGYDFALFHYNPVNQSLIIEKGKTPFRYVYSRGEDGKIMKNRTKSDYDDMMERILRHNWKYEYKNTQSGK